MNGFKKYLGLFTLVVFGGGLLIYAWSGLQGKNLAQPPQFDLSVYENPAWYQEEMEQAYAKMFPAEKDVGPTAQAECASDDCLKAVPAEFVYFRKAFCNFAGEEAAPLIEKFLDQWPELTGKTIEFISDSPEFCARVGFTGSVLSTEALAKIRADYAGAIVIK